MEDKLSILRKKIDSIDDEIVSLLSKRMAVVKEVGKLKKEHKVELLDVERLEELIETKKKKARIVGISQSFIEKLFMLIHDHSIKTQKKI
jgi:chorismate mutase